RPEPAGGVMATRDLDSPPSILPLYARAAAPMIPGASLLPFIPGRGKEIPDLELSLAGIRTDPGAVSAYAKVCGFALRDHLPPTYPHVLAFPLHMAVMADGSFPFGAVGLVHVENRIVQHRRIGLDEELKLTVRPTKLESHPRGKTFSLLTEAWVGRQKVWESVSTMLRRGGGNGAGPKGDLAAVKGPEPTVSAEWRLDGDLGRRYAAVSGDRNPIHMHAWTAKPLGFQRAIAHGMWTKARCLAAIESHLPDTFSVDVRFRKPIFLPGRVEFLSATEGEESAFAVRDAKKQIPHLDGHTEPVEAKPRSGRNQ
ncbi:MAG TPA: MaoC/PaaZ C-terminal domain-containing protein, partial [Solirubrobacterales bacterium]|nr:MaoC/PaaZ C-terminal domain-containing protein [Solirubrobacterales bacterium]